MEVLNSPEFFSGDTLSVLPLRDMLATTLKRPFGPLSPLSLPQHLSPLTRAWTILAQDKLSRFLKLD